MKLTTWFYHNQQRQKGIASLFTFLVLGILVAVIPITTKLVQNSQENRGRAAESSTYDNSAEIQSAVDDYMTEYYSSADVIKAAYEEIKAAQADLDAGKITQDEFEKFRLVVLDKRGAALDKLTAAEDTLKDLVGNDSDAYLELINKAKTEAISERNTDEAAEADKKINSGETKVSSGDECTSGTSDICAANGYSYCCSYNPDTGTTTWNSCGTCSGGTIDVSTTSSLSIVPTNPACLDDDSKCESGSRYVCRYNVWELEETCSNGCDGNTCKKTNIICNFFEYTDWSSCASNGIQTRSVISSSPAGCIGGEAVISQGCKYVGKVDSTIASGGDTKCMNGNVYMYFVGDGEADWGLYRDCGGSGCNDSIGLCNNAECTGSDMSCLDDSTVQYCSNGKLFTNTCQYGCSNGACNSASIIKKGEVTECTSSTVGATKCNSIYALLTCTNDGWESVDYERKSGEFCLDGVYQKFDFPQGKGDFCFEDMFYHCPFDMGLTCVNNRCQSEVEDIECVATSYGGLNSYYDLETACPEGLSCDQSSGTCETPQAEVGSKDTGDFCDTDAECESTYCMPVTAGADATKICSSMSEKETIDKGNTTAAVMLGSILAVEATAITAPVLVSEILAVKAAIASGGGAYAIADFLSRHPNLSKLSEVTGDIFDAIDIVNCVLAPESNMCSEFLAEASVPGAVDNIARWVDDIRDSYRNSAKVVDTVDDVVDVLKDANLAADVVAELEDAGDTVRVYRGIMDGSTSNVQVSSLVRNTGLVDNPELITLAKNLAANPTEANFSMYISKAQELGVDTSSLEKTFSAVTSKDSAIYSMLAERYGESMEEAASLYTNESFGETLMQLHINNGYNDWNSPYLAASTDLRSTVRYASSESGKGVIIVADVPVNQISINSGLTSTIQEEVLINGALNSKYIVAEIPLEAIPEELLKKYGSVDAVIDKASSKELKMINELVSNFSK